MADDTLTAVTDYIDDNIYHSSVWDEANSTARSKAINNSIDLLIRGLDGRYSAEEDIPINILANQVVWFMRIDDTFLRAEMGASYIQMSGVMVNLKDKDLSIAPYVLDCLGISPDPITGGVTKRKVGRYITSPTVGTDISIFRSYGREDEGQ